ncbi:MFS transporter [Candidatus Pseudothioglobus singularis]|uniref:MFS transporter n=1 Tax=Candidatus Pseudothioglobus singularis PS1 TaxID=1125411 RepID=A0A0M4M1A8_9GAMM|nr:MFS transporter [Candidatus Pseudothioglobus singularis]ALE02487.1 MFS transporter [Candidatus Pseudothioglobus singularis PS1]
MVQHKKIISLAIALACVLLAINFGLRSSLGLFLKPVSETFGYGREVFAFSLALQNLFWGLSQPIAGAFADKFGTSRVIILGTLFYSLGLYITATADSFMGLHIGAGILIGMGIAGTGLGVILPAMARMVSPEKRAMALGIGTAAGSAGQFLLIPVAREFLVAYGWQTALIIMAIGALSMILFSPVFKGDEIKNTTLDNEPSQTLKEALNEASRHIHYWLLIAGFFVCGFQLAFIVVHMPSYLADKGFDSSVAAASLSIIGLCNIFGSLISGHFSGIYSKKWILTYIYAARSIIIVLFLITPISTFTIYAFSFATGFLWLATVPPTSGLVAQMFGLRFMGTLYGIVFLNHQIGSFTGVWIGGYLFDTTGSYDQVWWWAAIIAAITALIHVYIDERPIKRIRANVETS